MRKIKYQLLVTEEEARAIRRAVKLMGESGASFGRRALAREVTRVQELAHG